MKNTALLFGLLVFISSCSNNQPQTFSEKIETAHEKEAFLSKQAISFDLLLEFGGNVRLDGRMTLLTNSTKGFIEEKNGDLLYFDNEHIYYDSSKLELNKARFKAYTWSYFFLFPYKLTDPGTVWNEYSASKSPDENYEIEKLTFDPGTGDAPDDWYVVYADKESHLLQIAAYIVTANKTQAEAEEDPHAIEYLDYKTIDGVPFATKWKFHGWQPEQGLTEQLGEAELSNIEFVQVDSNFFNAPENLIEG